MQPLILPGPFGRFGGISPILEADALPDNGAQTALNVDLTGGILAPLTTLTLSAPMQKLWSGTSIPSEVPLVAIGAGGDFGKIDQPSAPTASLPFKHLLRDGKLSQWLRIYAYGFQVYLDSDGVPHVLQPAGSAVGSAHHLTIDDDSVIYNDMTITFKAAVASFADPAVTAGQSYDFYGPIFRVVAVRTSQAFGGWNGALDMPLPANFDPDNGTAILDLFAEDALPPGAIPLTRFNKVYGALQFIDVHGPDWNRSNVVYGVDATYPMPGGTFTFTCRMNYTPDHASTQYVRYLQSGTQVNSDDSVALEGPPSNKSDLIAIRPGEIPLIGGLSQHNMLYSSTPQGQFVRIGTVGHDAAHGGLGLGVAWPSPWEGENPNAYYEDQGTGIDGPPLPEYGNYDDYSVQQDDLALNAFYDNAILHPAQFLSCFVNYPLSPASPASTFHPGLQTVRNPHPRPAIIRSARYRLHAFPLANNIVIPSGNEILAHLIAGGTELVWTTDKAMTTPGGEVLGIGGSNPDAKSSSLYSLAKNMPLLNRLGLAKLGQTVLWPTYDGLAASGGSDVQNLTIETFRRQQWATFNPASLKAWTLERSVFLSDGSSANLRIDIGAGPIAVSTFTWGTPGNPATFGTSLTWESKLWRFPRPECFAYVRIVAAGPVDLTVKQDGTANGAPGQTISNDTYTAIAGAVPCGSWSFKVTSAYKIYSITFLPREVNLVQGDTIVLTPENTPLQEDIWTQFQNRGRWVAASMAAMKTTGNTGTLSIYPRGYPTSPYTAALSATTIKGNCVALPRALASNPLTDLVRMGITSTYRITEVTLYQRRTKQGDDTILVYNTGDQCPEWLHTGWEYPLPRKINSITVDAESDNVVGRIFIDDDETGIGPMTLVKLVPYVPEDNGFDPIVGRRIEFREDNGDDYKIKMLRISMQTVTDIPPGGLTINDPATKGKTTLRFPDRDSIAAIIVTATAYSDSSSVQIAMDGASSGTGYFNAALTTGAPVTNGSLSGCKVGKRIYRMPRTLAEGTFVDVSAVQAEGDYIESIQIIPRWREKLEKGQRDLEYTSDDPGVFPWLPIVLEANKIQFMSGRIDAESYPSPLYLRLFKDGLRSETPSKQITVTDGNVFAIDGLDGLGPCQSIEMDLAGNDYLANAIKLFGKEALPITNGGIVMRGVSERDNWRMLQLNLPGPGAFTSFRIKARDYTGMYFDLYSNGTRVVHQAVADDSEIAIDWRLLAYKEWVLDIPHTGKIDDFFLFGRRTHEVTRQGRVVVPRESEPFSTLEHRWKAPRPIAFAGVWAYCDRYPVMFNLMDPSGKTILQVPIQDREMVRIPDAMRTERTGAIGVVAASGGIVEEFGAATSMEGRD